MSLDLETRCFQCKVYAYVDRFDGEYGESGYLCMGCIRRVNFELMKAAILRDKGHEAKAISIDNAQENRRRKHVMVGRSRGRGR